MVCWLVEGCDVLRSLVEVCCGVKVQYRVHT